MKLNIGSGGKGMAGWVSIDIDPTTKPDIVADFRFLNFGPGLVEAIYASHVFEHYSYREGEKILALWRSWLPAGGTLWLAVPDFEAIARVYCGGEWNTNILGLLYGADCRTAWAHCAGYTEAHLRDVLERCGFACEERFAPINTIGGEAQDFTGAYHDGKHGRTYLSLNLKARRK